MLPAANIQKEECKKDLAGFVFSHTSKSLDELIFQTAQITLQRRQRNFIP